MNRRLVYFVPMFAVVVCAVGLPGSASAADIVKADNTTSLVSGGSWVGGVAPTSIDTAVFNGTYTQAGTLGTGAALSYLGLEVTTGPTTININNTTANNHIELGTGGLDMSTATRSLIIQSFNVGADQTWNVNGGQSFTVGGTKFAGGGNIIKSGAGTATIDGNNTHSGTYTVSGGTLELRKGAITNNRVYGPIAAGATLEFNVTSGTRNSQSTNLSGGGTFRKTGAGTYAVFSVSSSMNFGGSGLIDIQAGTFDYGAASPGNWSSNLADMQVNSGATFQGEATSIRIDALNDGTSGGGTVRIGGISASTAGLTIGANGGSGSFSGTISNAGTGNQFTLEKIGAGTQILSGANSYTGGTTITQGTLYAQNASALGSGSVTLNGGRLQTNVDLTNAIILNNTANQISPNHHYRELSGQISGAGGFTLSSGGGTPGLSLSNTANNFAGNVTINAGTFLRTLNSEVIPDTASITNNGNLRLDTPGGGTETIAGLSGSGSVWVPTSNNNLQTLRVGAGDTASTFVGTLGAIGQNNNFLALTKIGNEKFTLTNSGNRFRGGVNINGGTLSVSQLTPGNTIGQLGAAFGTAPFLTFDGGTLEYTGGTVGGINRAFTVNSGGATIDITQASTTVTWTDAAGAGSIVGSGSFTKAGDGTLALSGNHNLFMGNTLVADGTLQLNNTLLSNSDVTIGALGTLTGNGTVGALTNNGTLKPGFSPGLINSGNYAENGNLAIEILGSFSGSGPTVAGTDHSQINVTGTVDLNATSTLSVTAFGPTGSFAPTNGTVFTIINNDGSDAVGGTLGEFSNAPAGTTVTSINGVGLVIFYNGENQQGGADGFLNDVVLVANDRMASALYVDDQFTSPMAVDGNQETGAVEAAYVGVDAFSTTGAAFGSQVVTFNGPLTLNGNATPYTLVDLDATNAGDVILNLVADEQGAPMNDDVTITTLQGSDGDVIELNSEGNGKGNLIVGGSAAGAFDGIISGDGTVTKNTSGTLRLGGPNANDYTGTTTISNGILQAEKDGALGSAAAGTEVTSTDAQLRLVGGVNIASEPLQITGDGPSSGGALRSQSGSNTYGGPITLTGDATITSNSPLDLNGTINNAGFDLTLNASGSMDVNNVISGAGDLNKGNAGPANLNAANLYGGDTNITGGTLRMGVNAAIPNGSNVLVDSATLDRTNFTQTIGTLTLDDGVVNDIGTLILGGNVVSSGNSFLGQSGSNGTTDFGGTSRTFNVSGTLEVFDTITGTGNLTKSNSGTMILENTNSYTGDTNVIGGVLRLDATDALPSGTVTTVNSATLRRSGGTTNTVGLLTLTSGTVDGTGTLVLDGPLSPAAAVVSSGTSFLGAGSSNGFTSLNGDRTFNVTGGVLTVNDVLQGAGSTVTKIGDGTMTVTNHNTYTGDTVVNDGTFRMTSGSLQNANVFVNNDTTFQHDGGTNNVTQAGTGTHLTVAPAAQYNLTGGELTFGDTATPNQTVASGNGESSMLLSGDFNFSGGTLSNVTNIDVDNPSDTFTVGNGSGTDDARLVIGVDGGLDANGNTVRAYTHIQDAGGTDPIDLVLMSDGTIAVDIFGPESHGINGEQGGSLPIDPLASHLDSDILHVTGDATLAGLLSVDLNGYEPFPFAFYDVLYAEGTIDDSDLDIEGVHLFRVVDNPVGPGQILQVAVPEPASIAIWSLLALALTGFAWRKMRS